MQTSKREFIRTQPNEKIIQEGIKETVKDTVLGFLKKHCFDYLS